nr:hypothetical protein [Micromonospora sp. DSM 115978]
MIVLLAAVAGSLFLPACAGSNDPHDYDVSCGGQALSLKGSPAPEPAPAQPTAPTSSDLSQRVGLTLSADPTNDLLHVDFGPVVRVPAGWLTVVVRSTDSVYLD